MSIVFVGGRHGVQIAANNCQEDHEGFGPIEKGGGGETWGKDGED